MLSGYRVAKLSAAPVFQKNGGGRERPANQIHYALVEVTPVRIPYQSVTASGDVITTLSPTGIIFPAYRGGWEAADWFFSPMHELDKRIRVDVWK